MNCLKYQFTYDIFIRKMELPLLKLEYLDKVKFTNIISNEVEVTNM